MNDNLIKCAFCDWKTKRYTTIKGKHKSGYKRLRTHVEMAHHDKFVEIMKQLEDAFGETENV